MTRLDLANLTVRAPKVSASSKKARAPTTIHYMSDLGSGGGDQITGKENNAPKGTFQLNDEGTICERADILGNLT